MLHNSEELRALGCMIDVASAIIEIAKEHIAAGKDRRLVASLLAENAEDAALTMESRRLVGS